MNQINHLIRETKKYLTKYDYENVILCCDKILEIRPESSYALRFKALSYHQMGNLQQALICYEKLYGLNPFNKGTIYSLAVLHIEMGDYDEAIRYYEKLGKDTDELNYKLISFLTKNKMYDTIISQYDEKLKSLKINDAYNREILVLLEEKAVFHYRNKEYKKAYNIFKEISDNYPTATENTSNPYKHCNEWYNTLQHYIKEYDEPQEFFNNMFILDDEDNGWEKKIRHNIGCNPCVFGDLLIELNPNNIELLENYGNATYYSFSEYSLKCYNKILEIDPNNRNAFDQIISIYSNKCLKDKALKLIDSKLEDSRLRTYLLKQKIELLESMTLYNEALESYEIYFKYATRTDKDLASMKVNHLMCMELYALDLYNQDKLGESYNILKDTYDQFKKISNYHGERMTIAWYNNVLRDAIDKSDDNPEKFFNTFYLADDNQKTKIWINKIDSITKKFEPQKHIGNRSYYEILSEKNPDNYELAIYGARKYYHGLIQPQKALPIFNRVLEIDPRNKEVLNQKFKMLVSSGQYDDAYDLLAKIEVDYQTVDYSLRRLAEVYMEKNEYSRAKYCLELILNYCHDNEVLKKLKLLWHRSNDTKSQNDSQYYMDWISLIQHKHEENLCPQCKNKLIPIKYGVIMANDPGFKAGKYYASEKIKNKKNRPTDYCKTCKKEIYHGFCGINLVEDNTRLSWYTKLILNWFIQYLEENKKITNKQLEEAIYEEFSINKKECEAFLIRLESINFIENKNDTLKLWSGYTSFRNSLDEMYHFRTSIFKNQKELDDYANTIRSPEVYSNIEDYIEDVKICLMAGRHYSYESATKLLKGDEGKYTAGRTFKADAWATATEECFFGG